MENTTKIEGFMSKVTNNHHAGWLKTPFIFSWKKSCVFSFQAREIFIKIDKRKNTINVSLSKTNVNVKINITSTPTQGIFHIV